MYINFFAVIVVIVLVYMWYNRPVNSGCGKTIFTVADLDEYLALGPDSSAVYKGDPKNEADYRYFLKTHPWIRYDN